MIGIIGPRDSVDMVLATADDIGMRSVVTGAHYDEPSGAVSIVAKWQDLCRVLVFTGWVPYALATTAAPSQAERFLFIPHSGATLHRALSLLLIENGGRLPVVSIDTIPQDEVRETYSEIGQPAPVVLHEPDDQVAPRPETAVPDAIAFHRAALRGGDAAIALTCLGSVQRQLADEGLPVRRLVHTRSAIRTTLSRAMLAHALDRSRSTQVAVMLVRLPPGRRSFDSYAAERERLRERELLLDLGQRLQGHSLAVDDDTYLISTSRGAVEQFLRSGGDEPQSLLRAIRLSPQTRLGIGMGASITEAELNARAALEAGPRGGGLRLASTDDEVLTTVPADDRTGTMPFHPGESQLAARLGLGPGSLHRMLVVLTRMDTSSVTADSLAQAYGIQTGSARRLLGQLRRAGFAAPVGKVTSARVGRPQSVYSVDIAGLLELTFVGAETR